MGHSRKELDDLCYGGLLEVDVWRKTIAHYDAMIARTEAIVKIWLEEIAKQTTASEDTASKDGIEEKCQETAGEEGRATGGEEGGES